MTQHDIVIVGGGIAGTTLAVYLKDQGKNVLLLEASPRLGGKVDTLTTQEATFEYGPNSFTDQCPEIMDLIGRLGRSSDILCPSPTSKNRYILKRGHIVRLPSGPQEMMTTQALSLKGRLRFLADQRNF